MATSANCVYWFISVGRAIAYNMRGPGIESQRGYCINRRHHILYSTITLRMSYKRLLLYWMLVNIGLSSQWRYVEMKRKINPFPLSFLTKIWTPSTWGISNTMNLLKLWFHLYSKINLLLSFHIPILHPLHPHSLIINVYCRTAALMTPKLNLLIVLVHQLKIQLQTSCPLCGWLYQKIDKAKKKERLIKKIRETKKKEVNIKIRETKKKERLIEKSEKQRKRRG